MSQTPGTAKRTDTPHAICYNGASYFTKEYRAETGQQQESAYNAKSYSAKTAQWLGLWLVIRHA
jgi:hypothetical protein